MSHFPLLVFLGNLIKRVLKHVSKNRLLQIYERAWKHIQIEYVRECLTLLSALTQALRCTT